MKIAQVSATFPPYMAGTGNVCYHYAMELAKLGHDVTVFTSRYPNEDFEYPESIKVTRFKPLFRIGNAPFIPQLLRIKDYDIIHLHYPFFFGGEMIYLHWKLRGEKYVVSYHNNVDIRGFLEMPVKMHSKLISKRILTNAEKVIVPTLDFYNSSVRNMFNLKETKVVEIPNGVDLSLFVGEGKEVRARYNLDESCRVILFVGALDKAHYYKGLEILMGSFKQLLSKYKDIKLMIIGDGNLKKHYVNLSKEYNIEKSTIFTGKIYNFEDLAKHYLACDIVVYPTITIESFGMVLIEAMAAEKPVIGSNVPGIRVVVDDGVNGFLVKPKNVEELTSKIDYLLENEDIMKEFGKRGRKKVEEKYSWGKIVRKVEEVYDNCF
ncbi:MAG: N-acetyl-alpha-D-glucosaminyl L-malate synthase [candidate division WS2 bacterium]|nr:N-acetyl-alpha-D-glucosaminyl L-malate synthase [Candidatus Psychracetigena formicireducens]